MFKKKWPLTFGCGCSEWNYFFFLFLSTFHNIYSFIFCFWGSLWNKRRCFFLGNKREEWRNDRSLFIVLIVWPSRGILLARFLITLRIFTTTHVDEIKQRWERQRKSEVWKERKEWNCLRRLFSWLWNWRRVTRGTFLTPFFYFIHSLYLWDSWLSSPTVIRFFFSSLFRQCHLLYASRSS